MKRLSPGFILLLICLHHYTGIAQTSGADTIYCGGTRVLFRHDCWREIPGVQFLHVHENEKTAVEATQAVLAKHNKGCFVSWSAQGDRYVSFDMGQQHFKIDPNRVYSAKGLEASLKKNGAYSKEAFNAAHAVAQHFLNTYILGKKLLVAVHNNTEGELTVHSFVKAGETQDSYINKQRDQDDFFLTTDPWIFDYLKTKKFNIVLQKQGIPDDGSLSVYAANQQIPYINIEAQHGHLEEQKQMLEIVLEMTAIRFQ